MRNRRAWIIALVAIVGAIAVGVVFALTRDDSSKPGSGATTTHASQTSAPTTTSTTTSATTTTTPAPDVTSAVWPYAASATRYTDPVAAARGFAVDFVGFSAPGFGAFRPGDARSGEVDVRGAGGQITTVLVRQLGGDGSWWVLGATTANIRLEQPPALAIVSSPVRLQGRSTAFEGTVQTAMREDGVAKPLGSGFVMGGAASEPEPFDGTLTFSPPTAASGALILSTISAENGEISAATVVRVHFMPPGG